MQPAQTQAQMRTFSYDLVENTENAEDNHPPLLMKTKMRKLHQGHLHQGHLNQDHLHQDHPHQVMNLSQDHPHQVMKLSQIHPHQRSNLSRAQMKTHHPSNLKVIDRYDSSSVSIKGPNPIGLTL